MKSITFVFLLLVLAACSKEKKETTTQTPSAAPPEPKDNATVIADQSEADSLKGSLPAKAEGTIGSAHLSVRYYSPAVRGRIIWGGLVPLDRVWVTGAHMATSLEIDKDFSVAGTTMPAGKYAFFTAPGKESWTLIINKNWQQHLVDEYDPKLDAARLVVIPAVGDVNQERLQYRIVSDNESGGKLVVRWERVTVTLPITVTP